MKPEFVNESIDKNKNIIENIIENSNSEKLNKYENLNYAELNNIKRNSRWKRSSSFR